MNICVNNQTDSRLCLYVDCETEPFVVIYINFKIVF